MTVVVGHGNRWTDRSFSMIAIRMNMAAMSAVTAIGFSRNRRWKPAKLLIRSGPVSRLLLNEFHLSIDAGLDTIRFFPVCLRWKQHNGHGTIILLVVDC